MSKELEEKVREILRNYTEMDASSIDQIGSEDALAEWGLNSTGILKLIYGIEEEFEFQFEDDDFDAKNFQTISSLVSYIEQKK